jgi:hypothetical protein
MRIYFLAAVCVVLACSRRPSSAPAPAFAIGEFQDDYGSRHTVTATEWLHHPRSRYHIVRWSPDQHFLIAQNDTANRGAPGKWTRIDWVRLEGMAPYEWAFCLSAYEAPSAAAAEATTIAKPETPRTGCNGFPFTRMKRAATP